MEGVSTNIIVCDECGKEFEAKQIEFKTIRITLESKEFEVVFYCCPECHKAYIVCMLDYWGKKLQDKYISALDNYRLACHRQASKPILKQKLKKVEVLKTEAMEYQNKLLTEYGSLIPEEAFIENNLE